MNLTNKFDEAFLYAHELHGSQGRKGTSRPYIGHLMGVCALVLAYGGDEDEAIAALLHDAPEDCGGRAVLEEIRRRFGERVARIVEGCTDTLETPKPAWRARKEAYVAHVRTEPADVRLVSCADKLWNVREILQDFRAQGAAVFERFTGKREGTLWYYRALVEAFRAAGSDPRVDALLDEFASTVSELEELAK
ncbi:MAG TPA: HD domain-containing protein [Candidatus Nitrosotenuis sp.]|nr:HD domain-containing protein [Candidatus Nitrosotenuis sp.]